MTPGAVSIAQRASWISLKCLTAAGLVQHVLSRRSVPASSHGSGEGAIRRLNVARAAPSLLATALVTGCAVVTGLVVEAPIGVETRPSSPDRAAARRSPPPPRVEVASWYGSWHHGRLTASGEPFDMDELTAAHRSLPLGACVEVTHFANGRRVYVRVNDRGPYVAGRTIDLSYRAAQELGMVDEGLAPVRIRGATPAACEAAGETVTD